MEKKYELTESKIYCGITLYRIKALRGFRNVKAGDLGGWVESELNLSHEGDCWIYNDAIVCNNAMVCKYAIVCNNAIVADGEYILTGKERLLLIWKKKILKSI